MSAIILELLHEQNETENAPLLPVGAGGESGAGVAENRSHDRGSELMSVKIESEAAGDPRASSKPSCPAVSELTASSPATGESTASDDNGESKLDLHWELYDAITTSNVAAVKLLLARGASLYCQYQDKDETRYSNALSVAIGFTDYVSPPQAKAIEVAKEVIAAAARAENKSEVFESYDSDGYTPMAWAILGPVLEVVEALVDAGASLENVTEVGESALHVAAGGRYPSNLKYFLDNLTRFNIKNTASSDKAGKKFPIHYVVRYGNVESLKLLLDVFGTEQLSWVDAYGNTVLHTIADWNSVDAARYLLSKHKYAIRMNSVNLRGETALYMSAVLKHVALVTLFLRKGASLSALGKSETAVEHVARNFADPLKFFEDIFDECISERWDRLFMNNEVIAERGSTSQIKVIEQLELRCGSKLLKHPLIESLIHMKWKCLLPAFYIIIATYMAFLAAFNVFVVTTFYKIDSYNATPCLNASGAEVPLPCVDGCDWVHWTLVGITYLCIGVLFIQECIWVCLRKLQYFVLVESWLRLAVLALACAAPAVGCAPAPAPPAWPRHVACAALLLAWLHALLLLARFSGWGYYAFERAAINLIKILSMAICWVISFATCFMVYYQSRPPFDGPLAAFLKTLVMMTSEFDYKDLFEGSHEMELRGTRAAVRLLFVLFVVFIAIVLMNFMTGVAVSDVKQLEDMGNIRRLVKQVELLSTLDGLWDTGLGKRWKKFSQLRFHPPIYSDLMVPGTKWKPHYVFSPKNYDDIEYVFTSELHNSIYDIAKKNRNKVDELCDGKTANNMKWDTDNTEKKCSNTESKQNDVLKIIMDRIKLIEDTNVEINQSIYHFKKDMKTILNTLASGHLNLQRDGKSLPGKRKNMQKRKKNHLLSYKKSQ